MKWSWKLGEVAGIGVAIGIGLFYADFLAKGGTG